MRFSGSFLKILLLLQEKALSVIGVNTRVVGICPGQMKCVIGSDVALSRSGAQVLPPKSPKAACRESDNPQVTFSGATQDLIRMMSSERDMSRGCQVICRDFWKGWWRSANVRPRALVPERRTEGRGKVGLPECSAECGPSEKEMSLAESNGQLSRGDNSWTDIRWFCAGAPNPRVQGEFTRCEACFERRAWKSLLLQQSSVSDFGPLLQRCCSQSRCSRIDGAPGFENRFQDCQGQSS
ncbi:hypothetical protein FJTKL_05752 [Diaporthe vaccinii]|uniref:Uncharacterized protein n=1 Tax=Diaporthe vaccinii TaxID=105482 RepID=A0ABR4EXW5_9PEZI